MTVVTVCKSVSTYVEVKTSNETVVVSCRLFRAGPDGGAEAMPTNRIRPSIEIGMGAIVTGMAN